MICDVMCLMCFYIQRPEEAEESASGFISRMIVFAECMREYGQPSKEQFRFFGIMSKSISMDLLSSMLLSMLHTEAPPEGHWRKCFRD